MILLTLQACFKPDPQEDAAAVLVVQGTLTQNAYFEGIRVSQLNSFYDASLDQGPVSGAELTLTDGVSEVVLEEVEPGLYDFGLDSIEILPGIRYDLFVRYETQLLTASVRMPPAIQLNDLENDVITIDTNSTGSPVLFLEWNEVQDHAYVIALDEPENGTIIPFDVPSGMFQESFQFPVLEMGALIYDTDFLYFGAHRIRVYAIDKEYETLYFLSPEVFGTEVLEGPGNVVGGEGNLLAASASAVEFQLE